MSKLFLSSSADGTYLANFTKSLNRNACAKLFKLFFWNIQLLQLYYKVIGRLLKRMNSFSVQYIYPENINQP